MSLRFTSDQKLIRLLQSGKGNHRRKAFDCLYSRYADDLIRYFCYVIGMSNEEAEDYSHDIFLKILEQPDIMKAGREIRPWLFRVASNLSKNHFRHQGVKDRFTEHEIRTNHQTDENRSKNISLKENLYKLKTEQRSVIAMRFKLKMSIKEMAVVLECPEGTVKSKLFYAIKELSKIYKN